MRAADKNREHPTIMQRGNKRWILNIIKASRTPEDAMLNVLSDVEAWLRYSLPHYRSSWNLKMKSRGTREYLRAAYILIEEFFADCKAEDIKIPRSGSRSGSTSGTPSTVERLIEGLG